MSLNWKELNSLINQFQPKLIGGFVQKIAQVSQLAGENALLINGYNNQTGAWHLFLSLQFQETAAFLLESKQKLKHSSKPSSFIMTMRKYLLGQVITELVQYEQERIFYLTLANKTTLLIELLPKWSNVVLLEEWNASERKGIYLTSFRNASLHAGGIYQAPAAKLGGEVSIRETDKQTDFNYAISDIYLTKLKEQDLVNGKKQLLTSAKAQLKKIETAIKKVQKEIRAAKNYQEWQNKGVLLTANLYHLGAQKLPSENKITLIDLEGNETSFSVDDSLSYAENAEKFFKKAKKLQRADKELNLHREKLVIQKTKLDKAINAIDEITTLQAIPALFPLLKKAGIKLPTKKTIKKLETKPFLEIYSGDGFRILCGRNRDENRRVTFKEAKGNDIWMHVKGQPGAHVVIKSKKSKTVPLSTLLDAAQLVLQYSKLGKNKKADIDYTERKYVKSIKGQISNVTYAQNKTIFVELDRERLRSLLQASE